MPTQKRDYSNDEPGTPGPPRYEDETSPSPIFVSVKKAAEILGVCPWTVRQEIARGKIAARKNGKRILPEVASIYAYAERLPKARLAVVQTAPGTRRRVRRAFAGGAA